MYMYVHKYISGMEMEHSVVFYKNYLAYSDIPKEEVEILYAYCCPKSNTLDLEVEVIILLLLLSS